MNKKLYIVMFLVAILSFLGGALLTNAWNNSQNQFFKNRDEVRANAKKEAFLQYVDGKRFPVKRSEKDGEKVVSMIVKKEQIESVQIIGIAVRTNSEPWEVDMTFTVKVGEESFTYHGTGYYQEKDGTFTFIDFQVKPNKLDS